MALAATTVWEINGNTGISGAAADNGGGYNASQTSAGTDYSLASNSPGGLGGPIAAPTKLACADHTGPTYTLTDADAPFTAAMVGNLIYILASGNFNAGWREIVAYTNTGSVELDADPTNGSDATAGHGHIGGCIDTPADALFEAAAALGGNIFYVKGPASYTTGAINVAAVGLITSPHQVIGYNATRAIWGVCDGTDRPVIAAAANAFTFGAYWHHQHLIITSTVADAIGTTTGTYIRNCKSTNTGTATKYAFSQNAANARIIDCEAVSRNGAAFYGNTGSRIMYCYIHDSVTGVLMASGGAHVIGCIIEACATVGVSVNSRAGATILNSTINDTGDGISGTNAPQFFALNNIISNMVSEGIVWTTQTDDNRLDYNDWYGNLVDATLVKLRNSAGTLPGPNDTDIDPGYTTTHSWTDIAVQDPSAKTINSPTGGFSTYYAVGDYIHITGGTGLTPGNYLINTVTDDTHLILNTSPGATGQTNGTATIVTSFKTGTNVADGFGIRQAVA